MMPLLMYPCYKPSPHWHSWILSKIRIVSAKAFPDEPNSQCKKPKNSSFVSPSLPTKIKTKNNCSWFEQSDASSAKIERNLLSFMSLIRASFINLPQQ